MSLQIRNVNCTGMAVGLVFASVAKELLAALSFNGFVWGDVLTVSVACFSVTLDMAGMGVLGLRAGRCLGGD